MTYFGATKSKTTLLGRVLLVCPVCNRRNANIFVQGLYHNDTSMIGIHSECEQELQGIYHPMNELKSTPSLAEDPEFIEDCRKRGITNPKKITCRGYKIEELLKNLEVTDNYEQIPLADLKSMHRRLHQ